ncbi:hypothetical protein GC170_19860 [bacterium]|nr:hypothetical protein [bacterium]
MSLEELRRFLLYCTIIDYALLGWWFIVFVKFRHELYEFHRRWFDIPHDMFDRIHYNLMGLFKIGIFLFNLCPLIALYLMGK